MSSDRPRLHRNLEVICPRHCHLFPQQGSMPHLQGCGPPHLAEVPEVVFPKTPVAPLAALAGMPYVKRLLVSRPRPEMQLLRRVRGALSAVEALHGPQKRVPLPGLMRPATCNAACLAKNCKGGSNKSRQKPVNGS